MGLPNQTFTGLEAITRLELKVQRVKLQLIFSDSKLQVYGDDTYEAGLLKLLTRPKELFFDLYRRSIVLSTNREGSISLHTIADRVAEVLRIPAQELRVDLIRELLVKNAVYPSSSKNSSDNDAENCFVALQEEERSQRDESIIRRIIFLAAKVVMDATSGSKLVEFLVRFARDTNPRAGVTFRAKKRAARVVLHLAQSNRGVVASTVEDTMKLAKFDIVMKELVDYIRHCQHMVTFDEHRVPYEISFVMRSKKEALVRSLLRQHPSHEGWVLRCCSELMLDFNVNAPDLWQLVLSRLYEYKMYRSLSSILTRLSQHSFARSIDGASVIWEATLLAPLLKLKAMHSEESRLFEMEQPSNSTAVKSRDNPELQYHGIPVHAIKSQMEAWVQLLNKCPFLDQIDVPALVVHMRDLTIIASEDPQEALHSIDLFSYAVRCAMVITRPSARTQALLRIIQSGAYMQVLHHACDASLLHELSDADPGMTNTDEGDITDQLRLMEAIFAEAVKRSEHERLLGSAFEQGFFEYLAANASIDRAIALLIASKRFEVAASLVEMLYESHPELASNDWSMDAGSVDKRKLLQHFVASSTSAELAEFRES
ncbi:hypothetical protein PINS_up000805 [Pythium insidiosum]|nr:hypothetical protein PINS_up000805 [Pythium insidiosum]